MPTNQKTWYVPIAITTAVTQAAKRGETLLTAEKDLRKMLGDITKLKYQERPRFAHFAPKS
jgi:hypothetical protein